MSTLAKTFIEILDVWTQTAEGRSYEPALYLAPTSSESLLAQEIWGDSEDEIEKACVSLYKALQKDMRNAEPQPEWVAAAIPSYVSLDDSVRPDTMMEDYEAGSEVVQDVLLVTVIKKDRPPVYQAFKAPLRDPLFPKPTLVEELDHDSQTFFGLLATARHIGLLS